MRVGIALVVVSMGTAFAGTDETARDRPRLEEFAPSAPAWAKDCTLDLVQLDAEAFSVAVNCRGSEELLFERRAMTTKEFEARVEAEASEGAPLSKISLATARGSAIGYATTFEGGAHVLVRRANGKGASDVYACTSTAEREQLVRCKALVELFGRSTVVRRGASAFARPKS